MPEVQQKLMRHGSIEMTMTYGQNHMLDLIRPANAKLVEELVKAGGAVRCASVAPSEFVIGRGGRI